jgi:hypothetical protein
MTPSRHIPGPWQADWSARFEEGQEMQWYIVAGDVAADGGLLLADLTKLDGYVDAAEVAATAQLMAAAPVLLAALEKAIAWATEGDLNDPKEARRIISVGRIAIASTKGGPS